MAWRRYPASSLGRAHIPSGTAAVQDPPGRLHGDRTEAEVAANVVELLAVLSHSVSRALTSVGDAGLQSRPLRNRQQRDRRGPPAVYLSAADGVRIARDGPVAGKRDLEAEVVAVYAGDARVPIRRPSDPGLASIAQCRDACCPLARSYRLQIRWCAIPVSHGARAPVLLATGLAEVLRIVLSPHDELVRCLARQEVREVEANGVYPLRGNRPACRPATPSRRSRRHRS